MTTCLYHNAAIRKLLGTASLLLTLLQSPFLAAQSGTALLKLYWPLDQVTNGITKDLTNNGFDGTVVNNPVAVENGKAGGALWMPDRQGRYIAASSFNWQPIQFSLAWWNYTESYGEWCNTLSSSAGWNAFVFHSGLKGEVYVGTDVATRIFIAAGTVELNKWQHFAFTFDRGTARFYKNGQVIASRTGMTLPKAWNGFNVSGADTRNALHGLIDELRIYDGALTEGEVNNLTKLTGYPVAQITTPLNYSAITVGNNMTIKATATSSNSTIRKVEFFEGYTKVGAAYASPYRFSLPVASAGSFFLTAKVTDAEGRSTTSDRIHLLAGNQGNPFTNGLAGYWPFEEGNGSTAFDASGSGKEGTLMNAPAWATAGKINGCLEMLDNQKRYVSVPGVTWRPTAFSVSWWLHPRAFAVHSHVMGSGQGWGGFIFHTSHNGEVYVGTDVNTRFTPTNLPAGTIQLNQWQHLVFTFDNGMANFYKNGKLLASKTTMTNPVAWSGFTIGWPDEVNAIVGKVDEIRLYSRALTATEVSFLANATTNPEAYVWTGEESTDWNAGANWQNSLAPGHGSDVVINACTTCPVLPSAITIRNLTVEGGKLNLASHILTASATACFTEASISSNGGRIRAGNFSEVAGCTFTGVLWLDKMGGIENTWKGGNHYGSSLKITNVSTAKILLATEVEDTVAH